MNFTKEEISFQTTNQFSALFLDYINREPALQNLYSNYFNKEGFEKYFSENNFNYVNRVVLVNELTRQNSDISIRPKTRENISSLANANTFTITTGHQLCLFTGPLYFIYKIITTITLSKFLNKQFPDKHFVPVYWMASEDHDFEEINHANVFGKKITWETSQKGKVGSFKTEGINETIDQLAAILGDSENAGNLIRLFRESYAKSTLAEATRFLVNELFGGYGLVILDGDSRELKKLFTPEIKKELSESFSYKAVTETTNFLKANNYTTQVHPRKINLFYAEGSIRERIEKNGNSFSVLNTDLSFTTETILQKTESSPEVFSPNVVLRPLYQQKILPNAAYVGGPGELAYWLQLKKEFEVSSIHFPVLMPRKFALIIEKSILGKLEKLDITSAGLFQDTELLIKKLIAGEVQEDFSEEKKQLKDLFTQIKTKTENTDKTLGGTVEGELQKSLKGIETIEQKIIKALKIKNETAVNQVRTIRQKLFPENSIQERYDNFSAYYIKNPDFIKELIEVMSTDLDDLKNYLLIKEN